MANFWGKINETPIIFNDFPKNTNEFQFGGKKTLLFSSGQG